jgi:SAM-dependent methyltransferase
VTHATSERVVGRGGTRPFAADRRPRPVSLKHAMAVWRPRVGGAARSLRNRGEEVFCPCCEGRFARFLPHRGRPAARCPKCGSLERHRLLIGYLRNGTDLFGARLRVLHVAPEYSLQKRLRASAGLQYRSADLDSPLAMDRVDLLDMTYPDHAFDVVICSHVLEHVEDDRKALAEIRRVLADGGRAFLMSPVDKGRAGTLEDPTVTSLDERDRVFGQSDHVRRYGRDFADRVRSAGFQVQVVAPLAQLPESEIALCGLRRGGHLFCDEDIFVCRRAAEHP